MNALQIPGFFCSMRTIISPCQKYSVRFIFSSACLLLAPLWRAGLNQKIGSRGSEHSEHDMMIYHDMMISWYYVIEIDLIWWFRLFTFHPKIGWVLKIRSFENGTTFLGQDMHSTTPRMMDLSFSTSAGKKTSAKGYSNLIIFTYSRCSKKCVAVEPSLFHCGCLYLWRPILNYRINFMEFSVGKSVNINDSDDIDNNNNV